MLPVPSNVRLPFKCLFYLKFIHALEVNEPHSFLQCLFFYRKYLRNFCEDWLYVIRTIAFCQFVCYKTEGDSFQQLHTRWYGIQTNWDVLFVSYTQNTNSNKISSMWPLLLGQLTFSSNTALYSIGPTERMHSESIQQCLFKSLAHRRKSNKVEIPLIFLSSSNTYTLIPYLLSSIFEK